MRLLALWRDTNIGRVVFVAAEVNMWNSLLLKTALCVDLEGQLKRLLDS